jgi:hypothetical protein
MRYSGLLFEDHFVLPALILQGIVYVPSWEHIEKEILSLQITTTCKMSITLILVDGSGCEQQYVHAPADGCDVLMTICQEANSSGHLLSLSLSPHAHTSHEPTHIIIFTRLPGTFADISLPLVESHAVGRVSHSTIVWLFPSRHNFPRLSPSSAATWVFSPHTEMK